MNLISKLKQVSDSVRKEINVYRQVMKDPRTPLPAKLILALAIGYLLLPIDLIPDFIPVFGQLDDIIIVPVILYIAIKLIPENIIEYHRNKTYGDY